jgi:anaerobic selenocysteine-containing dehydrogenase
LSDTSTARSFCRVCTAVCGILVDTVDGEVVKVRGDRDHPLTRGYTCPKGRALGAMHHHPQRLERPLVRRGGALQAVGWDDCLDDLAARLRGVIDRHGPSAVGIYFGSGVGMDAAGYRMAQSLQAAIGTPAKFSPLTIDGTAKVLVAGLVGGFPGLQPRTDYDNTRLLLYIGINPVISHGHALAVPVPPPETIRAVNDRGEVWVIDPRETETARFASGHLAPRPGTDFAILAWLIRSLLRDGADPDVLAGSAVDIDRLRAVVEPFDLGAAAGIADVPSELLERLLDSVRRAGRLSVETGTGVTMASSANVTQWLAWALMVVTDSMNRPGGTWFHPGFMQPLDAAPLPLVPPEALFGDGPRSRPELSAFIGEWPCAALPDEIEAGNIRAFLNLGGNLLTAFPDENALRPALEGLEVFASLEIIGNETTALSTHVLPTKDQLERADVTLWDALSPRVAAQFTPAVLDPVGERRSAWWVLSELCRRLGPAAGGLPGADGEPEGGDLERLAEFAGHARCSFETLVGAGYVEVDAGLPARWVDEHVERLGGWRLAPPLLVKQLQGLHPGAASRRGERSLLLVPRRQKRHVNAQFLYLGDSPEALLHPEDAAALGIGDGQRLVIRSERGEVSAIARLDGGIRGGTISVPHGHEHSNVNRLTDAAAVDPITGMAHYSGLPVQVSPG